MMYQFTSEIWVMILLNSLQWIHIPYFTTEFNTMNLILNIEFSLIFSNEFITNQIQEFRLDIMNSQAYIWIHILMNLYMNSKSIHLNSYPWIQILMNSNIHFIYEFIWICIWIHIIISYMNSYIFLYSPSQPHRGDQAGSAHTAYNDYMNSYNHFISVYEFI